MEGDVADDGHVDDHAHGLGPQVVDVRNEGNVVLACVFCAHAGDVVRRDFGVDERVVFAVLSEVGAKVLCGDGMASDTCEVEVFLISRFVYEHDRVGKVSIAFPRRVTGGFVPMLEARGYEIDGESFSNEELGEKAETGVAPRLVTEFHSHGYDCYFFPCAVHSNHYTQMHGNAKDREHAGRIGPCCDYRVFASDPKTRFRLRRGPGSGVEAHASMRGQQIVASLHACLFMSSGLAACQNGV